MYTDRQIATQLYSKAKRVLSKYFNFINNFQVKCSVRRQDHGLSATTPSPETLAVILLCNVAILLNVTPLGKPLAMKYFSAAIYLIIITSFLNGCKKAIHKPNAGFDYEKAAGLWVPYEVIDESGTVQAGPITASNLFGSYAESVQLNSDKTFIPVTWWDRNNITFKTQEAGTFQWLQGNILKFEGFIYQEWEVVKLESNDLWLKMYATSGRPLYKFKKQQ